VKDSTKVLEGFRMTPVLRVTDAVKAIRFNERVFDATVLEQAGRSAGRRLQ
jgi:uncharacterized glyoxalase superfamily protein PhnB